MAKKMRQCEKGGDVDPLEEANQNFEAEEAAKPKTEAKPEAPAPKPKAKVVTKEELAKSGLSLRDYMNKPQGLTRRESPPARDGSAQNARFKEEAPAAKSITFDELKTMGARTREKTAKDNYANTGPTDINSMMKARLQPKPKATFKYASGGSVTRGDGCAQRGKTRGMMR